MTTPTSEQGQPATPPVEAPSEHPIGSRRCADRLAAAGDLGVAEVFYKRMTAP